MPNHGHYWQNGKNFGLQIDNFVSLALTLGPVLFAVDVGAERIM
jgi:hypothetical protein